MKVTDYHGGAAGGNSPINGWRYTCKGRDGLWDGEIGDHGGETLLQQCILRVRVGSGPMGW